MDTEKKPNKSFLQKLGLLFFILVLLEKGLSYKFFDSSLNVPKIANHNLIPEISEKKFTSNHLDFPEENPSHTVEQYVYFIKFYGSRKNTQSRLVRVKRSFKGSLERRVKLILRELQLGPNEEEAKKGLLTTLPQEQRIIQKVKLQNGILHISITPEFSKNAGKFILKDRIDQINYSLFEIPEIQGIIYYLNKKRVETLGAENLPIPKVFHREKRSFVTLK